jgi:hypothetical protein
MAVFWSHRTRDPSVNRFLDPFPAYGDTGLALFAWLRESMTTN